MTQTPILSRLFDLATKRFSKDLSMATAETDFFETLGIDSYQAMELLTDLEDHFEVEIPDYELRGVTTFGALCELIERRV